MTNTVIRHYGQDRSSVPHPVTSHRCRTTLDPALVTCPACIAAPPPAVVPGVVVARTTDPDYDPHTDYGPAWTYPAHHATQEDA